MYKTIALFFISILSSNLQGETPAIEETAPAPEAVTESSAKQLLLSQAIQPRAEGAVWSYISAYFDEGKRVPGGSAREEVIQVKEIDGEACYLIKLTVDWRSFMERLGGAKLSEDDYSYYWEYFTEEGSFNYTCENRSDVPKDLESFALTLPYPAEKGHTYEAEGDAWEVIDDATQVSVKAGDFSCIVYETIFMEEDFPEEASRQRYYMALGVGLVRWEMDFKVDGKWVLDARDDLLEYKISEAAVVEKLPETGKASE